VSGARLLIQGGSVLGGDPGAGAFEQLDLLVEDGRIAAVEPGIEADAELLDASGCLVAPGFVDTHRHTWQTAMRGVCADWTLIDYFRGIRIGVSSVCGPEDVYAGNLAGGLEALDAGVTTVLDFSHCLNSPEHADEALRGLRESGLRAIFAYGMFPVPLEQPAFTTPQQRFADARRIRKTELDAQGGTVRMGIALTELGLVPWEVTVQEVQLARELDLMVTAHTGSVHSASRRREVELMEAAGLLDAGQVHVHCNACTDRELDLLADGGATVSVTPETELQMGMGYPVIRRAAERGIPLGLGCDVVSNNSGDIFTQMRIGLQAERGRANQPSIEAGEMPEELTLRTAEALRMATLGGAEALGLDSEIGSLEPGKAADVIVVRADGLGQAPVNDPVATLVLQCSAAQVDSVLVAGEPVKRGGELVGRDPGAAAGLVESSSERILAALEPRGGLLPPAPEGFLDLTLQAIEINLAGAPEVGAA
jgi:5-methylthioadenosine/S-adenosylhomocysteine deaminase